MFSKTFSKSKFGKISKLSIWRLTCQYISSNFAFNGPKLKPSSRNFKLTLQVKTPSENTKSKLKVKTSIQNSKPNLQVPPTQTFKSKNFKWKNFTWKNLRVKTWCKNFKSNLRAKSPSQIPNSKLPSETSWSNLQLKTSKWNLLVKSSSQNESLDNEPANSF